MFNKRIGCALSRWSKISLVDRTSLDKIWSSIKTLQPAHTIEIGLEQAPLVVFIFFPHLNMQKNLLIMGPNTKKSSKSVIFLIFNYE